MITQPIDLPKNDPGLSITDAAIEHIHRSLSLKKSGELPIGIRIDVKKAGCSGYEYVLEYAYQNTQKEWDYVFTVNNISLIIDKKTYLKFLKGGTQLDFKKEGLQEGLAFNNPNVGHQCGCGESFTLVDEES